MDLKEIKHERRALEKFVFFLYRKAVANKQLCSLKCFREWLLAPMNYWRSIELPFALKLLIPVMPGEKILDVGSPKLLSLFLSFYTQAEIYATDLIDYFIPDFELLKKIFKLNNLKNEMCDARNMQYPDEMFDKIFSISVVEHIPGNGDIKALREFVRVLKPRGKIILTVPYHHTHINEYTKRPPYWVSERKQTYFFQRRYSYSTLHKRLVAPGLKVEKEIFIAEKPLLKPYITSSGLYVHNYFFIDYYPLIFLLRKMEVPFITYYFYRLFSSVCHYLARPGDSNIRNVVLLLTKA